MAHVWQHSVYVSNVINAIVVWIEEDDYEDAYYYNLDKNSNLYGYNFEAQESIIADYLFVKNGLKPKFNKGSCRHLVHYVYYIQHVWNLTHAFARRDKIIRKYGIVRGM
jgi:hypothetical protein